MIKEYKNEIFKLLRESDLQFDFFDIAKTEESGLETSIISYKDSPFKFIIRQSDGSFDLFDFRYTLFAPEFPVSEIYPEQDYANFDMVKASIKVWINQISRYFDDSAEIDLWEEYRKGRKTLNFEKIEFDEQVDFSADEKIQVTMAINEFRVLVIQNFNANEDEIKIINDRLNYLIDAVDRSNKFDWKSIAVSSLISMSIALSLDTEKGELLLSLFKKVFSAIKLLTP